MRIVLPLLFYLLLFTNSYALEKIRFGVFAYKGIEQTTKEYQPLVDELNKKLDNRVVLKVLSQEDIDLNISDTIFEKVSDNTPISVAR